MYRINHAEKEGILLKQDKRIFKTSDLAVLWGINNKNTLWTTVKRYIKRGILFRVHKGLYSTLPVDKLDKYEIGCAICGSLSYITTETILQKEGIIMQDISKITLMGAKKGKFNVAGQDYICRTLTAIFLINRVGINDKNGISVATLNRAVADMQFINPKYYFDNSNAINSELVEKLQKEIGYK